MRTVWAGCVGFTVVAALAACSGGSAPLLTSAYDPDDPQTWTFEQVIDKAVSDAHAHDASQEQLDELDSAKSNGELTAQQARTAEVALRECLASAGATVDEITEQWSLGQVLYRFTYTPPTGVTDEDFQPVYNDCHTKNALYIEEVYANQPAAREALGQALTDHEAELKHCLTDMGGHNVDDMTINELWSALKDQSFGGTEYGYSQERDCVIDAGINW